MKRYCLAAVVILGILPACVARSEHQAAAPTGALLDFRHRVDAYAALQKKLATGDAAARSTNQGGEIDAPRKALADRIREARSDAKQGDLVTPAVATMLRAALKGEVAGRAGAESRASIRDDGPAVFRPVINADYPIGESLPTMPPNVLAILPTLPEGLDWRIAGANLILRDRDANLVLDFLLDVM
jgi:hypothetical protein